MRVACERDMHNGLKCKAVGIWRTYDVYKYDTKMWITINVSRYRTYMT